MGFDYQMTADGSQAVSESRKVEASLESVTKGAGVLADSLRRAFNGAVGSKLQAEMLATSSTVLTLSKSFSSVAMAMQQEEQMLLRIKGPLNEYTNQLTVLDALLNKDKISTMEYADQVARLNRELERSKNLPQGGAPAPAASSGGGLLSGLVTGAGIAVATQLTGALQAGVHAALEMGDAYVSMKNRLQGVTSSQAGLNSLLDSTYAIAQRTRSSWDSTNESFVRLTNSTKALGLAQPQVLDLTETIAKAVKMSGASASEASSGMLQLSQAFSSGTLQGDEFRTLAEAMPSMLDLIAKQMGKPRGELKDLASQGKITSDVLVRSFQGAKASIDAGFAKTAPTLADAWTMFKNEMTKVIGETGLVEKLLPLITAAAEGFVSTMKNLATTLGPVLSMLSQLGPVIKVAAGAMDIFNNYINPMGLAKNVIGGAIDLFSKKKLEVLPPIDPQINEEYTKHQEKLEKIRETYAQIGDQKPFINAKVEATEMEKKLDEIEKKRAMEKMADAAARVYDQMKNVNGEFEKIEEKLINAPLHLAKLKGALKLLEDKVAEKESLVHGPFGGDRATLGPTKADQRAVFDLRVEINKLTNEAELGPRIGKIKNDANELGNAIVELKGAFDNGIISASEYGKAMKALGIEASPLQKLFEEIKKPQKEFNLNLSLANILLEKGAINAKEYLAALERFRSGGVSNFEDILDSASGKYDKLRGQDSRPMRPKGAGTDFAGMLEGDEPAYESFGEYLARNERLAKAEEEVLKLEQQLRKERADQGPDLQKTITAWEEHNKKVRDATILTIKWKAEMRRLNEDAGQRLGRGIQSGLQGIKDQLFDIETTTKNLVTGAFTEFNSALAKSIIAGEGWADSFTAALKKVEEMLIQLALQILEMSLLQALIPGAGGGLKAVGGSGMGIWPSDIAALLSGYGASYGGEHDDGGLFRMTGRGGPDSQNVMMKLSPGEEVAINPRARSGRGGGGMRIVNIFDRREITAGMAGRDGDRVMHNFIRQNPGAVRSRMRRRN